MNKHKISFADYCRNIDISKDNIYNDNITDINDLPRKVGYDTKIDIINEDLQILDEECSVHMYCKKETNYDC